MDARLRGIRRSSPDHNVVRPVKASVAALSKRTAAGYKREPVGPRTIRTTKPWCPHLWTLGFRDALRDLPVAVPRWRLSRVVDGVGHLRDVLPQLDLHMRHCRPAKHQHQTATVNLPDASIRTTSPSLGLRGSYRVRRSGRRTWADIPGPTHVVLLRYGHRVRFRQIGLACLDERVLVIR